MHVPPAFHEDDLAAPQATMRGACPASRVPVALAARGGHGGAA